MSMCYSFNHIAAQLRISHPVQSNRGLCVWLVSAYSVCAMHSPSQLAKDSDTRKNLLNSCDLDFKGCGYKDIRLCHRHGNEASTNRKVAPQRGSWICNYSTTDSGISNCVSQKIQNTHEYVNSRHGNGAWACKRPGNCALLTNRTRNTEHSLICK